MAAKCAAAAEQAAKAKAAATKPAGDKVSDSDGGEKAGEKTGSDDADVAKDGGENSFKQATKAKSAATKPAGDKISDFDSYGGEKADSDDDTTAAKDGDDDSSDSSDDEDGPKEDAGSFHDGISCNGCQVSVSVNTSFNIDERLLQTDNYIAGVRWKCSFCSNYDLCDTCHTAGIHNEHRMFKIERPEDAPADVDVVRAISSSS